MKPAGSDSSSAHDASGVSSRQADARPVSAAQAGLLTIAVSAIVAMALGAGSMPTVRSSSGVRGDVVAVLGDCGAARVVAAVVAAACDLLGIGDRAIAVLTSKTSVAGTRNRAGTACIGRTVLPRMSGPGLHHLDLPPPVAR